MIFNNVVTRLRRTSPSLRGFRRPGGQSVSEPPSDDPARALHGDHRGEPGHPVSLELRRHPSRPAVTQGQRRGGGRHRAHGGAHYFRPPNFQWPRVRRFNSPLTARFTEQPARNSLLFVLSRRTQCFPALLVTNRLTRSAPRGIMHYAPTAHI